MFYSSFLTKAVSDFGSMCPIAQIGKIVLTDKVDTP